MGAGSDEETEKQTMRESTVEKAVCQWAKDQGIMVMKLAGPNQKGQPDRMFLRAGKAAFIEFKAPGKHLTALQIKWNLELKGKGFDAGWFDNSPCAIKWLKEIFNIQ